MNCKVVSTNTSLLEAKSLYYISRTSHSQMEHYFFSYLLTLEVDIIEMAQMWQYVIFLSL